MLTVNDFNEPPNQCMVLSYINLCKRKKQSDDHY